MLYCFPVELQANIQYLRIPLQTILSNPGSFQVLAKQHVRMGLLTAEQGYSFPSGHREVTKEEADRLTLETNVCLVVSDQTSTVISEHAATLLYQRAGNIQSDCFESLTSHPSRPVHSSTVRG